MEEIELPAFEERKAALPFNDGATSGALEPSEYLNQTRGLYRWSVDNECRFFIKIFDGTAPENKQDYKTMTRIIERHFYVYEPEL